MRSFLCQLNNIIIDETKAIVFDDSFHSVLLNHFYDSSVYAEEGETRIKKDSSRAGGIKILETPKASEGHSLVGQE